MKKVLALSILVLLPVQAEAISLTSNPITWQCTSAGKYSGTYSWVQNPPYIATNTTSGLCSWTLVSPSSSTGSEEVSLQQCKNVATGTTTNCQ
jgi:hypothetical protein